MTFPSRVLFTAAAMALYVTGLTLSGQAHAQEIGKRTLFTTYATSGGSSGEEAFLLNDNNIVAGRYGNSGKSVSGHALIWDASGPGVPQQIWTQPFDYVPGGPVAGAKPRDISNGAVLFFHKVENIGSGPSVGNAQSVVNLSASAFNDNGQVVGTVYGGSDSSGMPVYNARWAASASGAANVMSVNGVERLTPEEINNAGQIVGTGNFGGQTQAFLFDANTSQGRLLFNSPDVVNSVVWDINDAGQILGARTLDSGVSTAFLFDSASDTFQDLPQSTAGFGYSSLTGGAINNLGQIVFDNLFYDGTSWIDLRQAGGLVEGVQAWDINNSGTILASNYYYTGGYSVGGSPLSRDYRTDYLLLSAAVPEPASVLSMGLGLIALAAVVRRQAARRIA